MKKINSTKSGHKIMAAFDQGQVPTITCVNQATISMGVDFNALVAALQVFVDQFFAPIWGTHCVVKAATVIGPTEWGMVFLDNADAANALGYHDLTKAGLPLSKIFVKTTLASRELVEVTASHELAEMLVDPAVQLTAEGMAIIRRWKVKAMYAYEVCDAVEAFSFPVNGIQMTNFMYPSWFEGFRTSGKFDQMGLCKKPFQILRGGYMPIMIGIGRWTQVFGDKAAKKKFKKHAHPRGTSRGKSNIKRSCPRRVA